MSLSQAGQKHAKYVEYVKKEYKEGRIKIEEALELIRQSKLEYEVEYAIERGEEVPF